MTESAACVRDVQSLDDLLKRLELNADTILSIRDAIRNYLDGVVGVMETNVDRIDEELENAKIQLEEAEQTLSDAEKALEALDDDDDDDYYGYYGDDDDDDDSFYDYDDEEEREEAEAAVESARRAVESAESYIKDCEERYEQAKDIFDRCKEIRLDWHFISPFTHGGDYYLDTLGTRVIRDAKEKMQKIQEVLGNYLNVSFQPGTSGGSAPTVQQEPAISEYKEKEIREDAVEEIKKEQIWNARHYELADATRIVKCERCKRPIALCICSYTHHQD